MAFYNEDQRHFGSPGVSCWNPYCFVCNKLKYSYDPLEISESDDETMVTGGLCEEIEIIDLTDN